MSAASARSARGPGGPPEWPRDRGADKALRRRREKLTGPRARRLPSAPGAPAQPFSSRRLELPAEQTRSADLAVADDADPLERGVAERHRRRAVERPRESQLLHLELD